MSSVPVSTSRLLRFPRPHNIFGRRRNRTKALAGKNKPLNRNPINWKSQHPLTENQLKQKRDEFWETAPMFEGRSEIWNALKLVAEFVENSDYDMAQAILDGADILLPTGYLSECYDRLGTRYQLPLYVFSEPTNLVRPATVTPQPDAPNSEADEASTGDKRSSPPLPNSISSRSSNERTGSTLGLWSRFSHSRLWRIGFHRKHSSACSQSLDHPSKLEDATEVVSESNESAVSPYTLRIRLSSGADYALQLQSDRVTVLQAKHQLAAVSSWPVESQRWFVCGRPLQNNVLIRDCGIPERFMVQAFVYLPSVSN